MRKEIKVLAAIAVVVIIGAIIGTSYYRSSTQNERVVATSKAGDQGATAANLVRPDSYSLGPADAPVTLVEFLDPECEACAAFSPIVKKLLKDYEGKVRLVVRYMPLHPSSLRAAALTEAAGEQGKYWQMQELLFARQAEWGAQHGPANPSQPKQDIDALFERYAMELGLDVEKINADVKAGRYEPKLQRDLNDGRSLGVRQTPTFFVNGRQPVRFGEAELRTLIAAELSR